MKPSSLQCLILLTTIALGGCWIERMDAHYEHAAAARAGGAVARGWIPEWLPDEAINIRERHDLDTNDTLLRFEIMTGANPQPPSDCAPIPPHMSSPPRLSAPWWPAWESISSNYDLYACAELGNPGTLGINQSERVWIYWWDEV